MAKREPRPTAPSALTDPFLDAWRTLRPEAGSRDGPLPPLLVGMTVVTGIVDAFSYVALGHVFVANMTGNVVFIVFALAGQSGFSLWASLLAIAAFAIGAVAGGRIAIHDATHRGRQFFWAAAVELALITGAWIYSEVAGQPFTGACRAGLIALLGAALGLQNATARKLAVPDLTTTVLTLTITGIAADGPIAGGHASKVGRRLLAVLSMFVGALIGTLIVRSSNPELTLLAAVGVLGIVVVGAMKARGDGSEWAAPR